jgi:plasmid stabilization system protein ParE
MRTVEISAAARRDIDYLRAWLVVRAPSASRRAVRTILAAAETLAEFPGRGRLIRNNQRELTVRFSATG